jgi:hypothetical protein
MADISIDRLSLNMPESAQRGERLARKIADGLADPALRRGMPAGVSSLNISLHRAPDETDDALAGRIVAEIIQQLDRIA